MPDHTHGPDGAHHRHEHHPGTGSPVAPEPARDLTIEDGDLSPGELGRRTFLRSAGLLGAGTTTLGAVGISGSTAAAAAERTGGPARAALCRAPACGTDRQPCLAWTRRSTARGAVRWKSLSRTQVGVTTTRTIES